MKYTIGLDWAKEAHAVCVTDAEARAWVRVLWRCWVDGVEYDPDKHLSARALKAA